MSYTNNETKIILCISSRQFLFADRPVYGPRHAKNVSSDMCGQRRPRSACASAQSDQDLCCPLTDSLDTTECIPGEEMPWWDFAHVQDDVYPHILRMLEGTFSLNTAHIDSTHKLNWAFIARLCIRPFTRAEYCYLINLSAVTAMHSWCCNIIGRTFLHLC